MGSAIHFSTMLRSTSAALFSNHRSAILRNTSFGSATTGAFVYPQGKIPSRAYQLDVKTTVAKESTTGMTEGAIVKGVNDMIDVNPPRGTRDFPPEEMQLRNWLFGHFREVSRLFNFIEVDFPVLEAEALYIRKAGDEITQQLYNFEDKGGRRVALRPELTPSLARLILQKGQSLNFPLKWFCIGQCWRYERMTRGRRREHYQWNMDIVGVAGVKAEAELLSAIVTFFRRLGLNSQDVGIKVSNRKVLQAVLDQYSVTQESFSAVCIVVDKIEKVSKEEIEAELRLLGLFDDAIQGILDAVSLSSLDKLEVLIGPKCDALEELKELFKLAEHYGYADWLEFDASVVRGLAYYTGTVFEAFDRERKLRAICGGGRYDKLLSTFGGEDCPACGFGFGDAVIIELLKEKSLMPFPNIEVDDVIAPLEENLHSDACEIASRLRNSGRKVDMLLEIRRLKWIFKHIERVNAKRLIILGAREKEQGVVRVKDLLSRKETDVCISDLLNENAAQQ